MASFRRIRVSSSILFTALIASGPAYAGLLDPTAFASLGDFPSTPGTYYITTTSNNPPVLHLQGSAFTLQGVISNGVAVFDFDNITLGSGTSINETIVTSSFTPPDHVIGDPGPLPVALLSRGNIVISSGAFIDFSGQAQPLNGTLPGGEGGPGGTDGGGGQSVASGVVGQGGTFTGDVSQQLVGGKGGTGGAAAAGGGGGGGLELGASGTILIAGSVSSRGGNGHSTLYGGGGGSGGGILIHGSAITLTGSLNVSGGLGGTGSIPSRSGTDGSAGQIQMFEGTQAVPEPSSVLLAGLAALGWLGYGRFRRLAG